MPERPKARVVHRKIDSKRSDALQILAPTRVADEKGVIQKHPFDSPSDNHVIGYHGTSRDNAYQILSKGFEVPEEVMNGWLGDGIYFWTEAEFARDWAEKKISKSAAIIAANIQLGFCIDFDNSSLFGELLKSTFRQLAIEHEAEGKDLPKDDGESRAMTCLLINRACRNTIPEAQTVKGALDNDSRIKGTCLSLDRRTQICVRDLRNIINPRVIEEAK